MKLDEYEVFEKVRENKNGGGIMIGVRKDIDGTPVDVSPDDKEVEILVIELEMKNITIRFITAVTAVK